MEGSWAVFKTLIILRKYRFSRLKNSGCVAHGLFLQNKKWNYPMNTVNNAESEESRPKVGAFSRQRVKKAQLSR